MNVVMADEGCAVNSSAIASWNNVTENDLNQNVGQQSNLRGKEAFEAHNFGSTDANLARTAGVEARLMLKPRKMGRNTAGSSKGLRMLQVDGSISKTGEDDARSVSIELSSNLASCNNGGNTFYKSIHFHMLLDGLDKKNSVMQEIS